MKHIALWSVLGLCGCLGQQHSLTLEVTFPNGTKETLALSGEAAIEGSTGGGFTASWPSIAEWGSKVNNGLLLNLNPVQPGTQSVSGSLFIGKEVDNDFRRAAGFSGKLELEEVKWTGNGSFPLLLTGSVEGSSSAGHSARGRFTISTDDCNDNTGTDELVCGRAFGDVRMKGDSQKWNVGRWEVNPTCPPQLVEKLTGGTAVTMSRTSFTGAGSQALGCVVTYAPRNEVLCGFSEVATYDGCQWSTFAWAYPFPDAAPTYQVFAGTVGSSCEPKICGMQAFDLTWAE